MFKQLKWRILFILIVTSVSCWSLYPLEDKISLGLDLRGGVHLLLQIKTDKLSEAAKKDAADRVVEVLRRRIDQFGVREPSIQKQGRDKVIIQLPGVTDRERAVALVGRTAMLTFQMVSDDPEVLKKLEAGETVERYELKKDDDRTPLAVDRDVLLSGDTLVDAQMSFDTSGFGQPVVLIEFNAEGAKKFGEVTTANVGKRFAMLLDDQVLSAPVIQEPIPSGHAQISGRFTAEQAGDLSIALRAGALPAPVELIEEHTIGPLLGEDSIERGIRATTLGAILVFVFMAVYYLAAGLIADFALVINMAIILGALAMFKGTLTLPGIAGIALTIGMAVDANVLIYERIREEAKTGKDLKSAVAAGYHKAFSAILDSNVTTLIAALLLFRFGSGPLRGFALTLTIGIMASMFTAIVVTRVCFDLLIRNRALSKLRMLQFFKETKFNFIGKRRLAYLLSTVILVASAVVFLKEGERNFGVEFTGGALAEVKFKDAIAAGEVRSRLAKVGLRQVQIQQVGTEQDFLIRLGGEVLEKLGETLERAFRGKPFDVLKIEQVGPMVGRQLKKEAVTAVLLSLLGIGVYVTIRFRRASYAIAGVVALVHDCLVAMGIYALSGREIGLTFIAGILTVAGYSINDTIVIFDRIRENVRTYRKLSFAEIINVSVNQTLSRTILTSLTVLMTVACLYAFGGQVLQDVALVLLAGFISGVYSTVYIASPLVLAAEGRKAV